MVTSFSNRLQEQLNSNSSKTLESLMGAFADKSFALLFILLMAIPALPLPTGGVTHIFEIIVMLLAVELIVGRHNIWLPRKWLELKLPDKFWSVGLPKLMALIKRVEKVSKPRLSQLTLSPHFGKVMGVAVFIFTLFAFVAPPFSGLDTLPALGVVVLSLALMLEDILLTVVGIIIGLTGMGLVLLLGKLAFQLL